MLSKKQEAFLDQLKQRKAKLGLTQAAIAAYLRVSQASVSRKMKGDHPWTADEQDMHSVLQGYSMRKTPDNTRVMMLHVQHHRGWGSTREAAHAAAAHTGQALARVLRGPG